MASRRRGYWCHQCSHPVRLEEGESIICPCCGGGFLEEVSNSISSSPSPPSSTRSPAGMSPLLDFVTAMDSMATAMRQVSIQDGIRPRDPSQPSVLILRGGGAHGPDSDAWQVLNGRRLGGSGQDFERLVQQLLEGEPGAYGTPPATRAAIDSVARVRITREHLAGDNAGCAVCKDDFSLGNEVRQLPCSHLYHQDCIVPWLSLHGSCPVCRHEIGGTQEPPVRNSSSSRSGSSHLPWPFRR